MTDLGYKSRVFKYDPTNKGLFEKLFSNKNNQVNGLKKSFEKPFLYNDLKDKYGRIINTGLKVIGNDKKQQHLKDFYDSYDELYEVKENKRYSNESNEAKIEKKISQPNMNNDLPIEKRNEHNKQDFLRDRIYPNVDFELQKTSEYVKNFDNPQQNNKKYNYNEIVTSYKNYDIDPILRKSVGKKYLTEIKHDISEKEHKKSINRLVTDIENLKFDIKKNIEQQELNERHLHRLKLKNKHPLDDAFNKMTINAERLLRYKSYLNNLKRLRQKDFTIFEDNLESLITKIRNDVNDVNYSLLKDINFLRLSQQDVNVFKNEVNYHVNGIKDEMKRFNSQQAAEKNFIYQKYYDRQYLKYINEEKKRRLDNLVYDTSELSPFVINQYNNKDKEDELDEEYLKINREVESKDEEKKELYMPYSNHNIYKYEYLNKENEKNVKTKKVDFTSFEKSSLNYSEKELVEKIWRSQEVLDNFHCYYK